MKPALIALVLLLFFAAEACTSHRSGSGRLPPPPPPPSAPPLTESAPPPSPPPPPPTIPAVVKQPETAPAPKIVSDNSIPLEKGMEQVEDAGLEESLDLWAEGKEIDLKHVIKRTGVYVKVAQQVRWSDAKKRERDPADYDRLVAESQVLAKQLVDLATAGKTDEIKPASELLAQRCSECHNKYK